jgi:deazaflavin-dependent oxidoreductase (nitroreductase family)
VNGTPSRQQRLARLGARVLRTRWLVRAPIRAYKVRLGFLFGHRLLMLEHYGRVSGRRRYVILEVVDHRPGHYLVVAGFGERAQWLRNVQADPHVRLWVSGRPPAAATARRMIPSDTAVAIESYAARHPRSWAGLRPLLESTLDARIDELGTTLPMIDLELDPGDQ